MDSNESGWRWCSLDAIDCGQGLVVGPFVLKNELWSTSFPDPALIVTEVYVTPSKYFPKERKSFDSLSNC